MTHPLCVLAALLLATAAALDDIAAAPKPHVLFILVDDFGWGNVGWHRKDAPTREVVTPNMDALVDSGIELNRHYVHMMCTPTRTSLQSGRLPVHVQLSLAGPCSPQAGMPRNMTAFPQHLARAGYASHQVGKWDVGMATPTHTPKGRGYNSSLNYFGHGNWGWSELEWGGSGAYNPLVPPAADPAGIKDLWDTDKPANTLNGTKYEELVFRDRLMSIIDGHDSTTPLFLLYAPKIAHYPVQAPTEYQDRFSFIDEPHRHVYHAMVSFLDDQIGLLVQKLKDRDMYNNTLIVLSTDNGGYTKEVSKCTLNSTHGIQCFAGEAGANNWPHRGGKYSNFEGGIRGNAFVSGGFLPPAVRGTKLEEVMHITDWYATICALAGVDPADTNAAEYDLPPIDSINMWPLLSGEVAKSPRMNILVTKDLLVSGDYKVMTGSAKGAGWPGPQYPNVSSAGHEESTVNIECPNGCLFNVANDPTEHQDLAESMPAMTAKLIALKKQLAAGIWPAAEMYACKHPDECSLEDRLTAANNCESDAYRLYGGFYGPYMEIKN